MTQSLSFPMNETQTTLVKLELNADGLSYVRNVAEGLIDFVTQLDSESASVASRVQFMTMFTNTDQLLTSRFEIGPTNC